eukprot:TRINITY_DN17262_c0_g1_i1.p1 TRINITY_DN17262_c0_g1~~TRINITY_DN17262_c0_g1_i1.p1  ORF type:complete len:280 (-),score=34.46 TRINITY_DN17262_c0_g1_i1:447-1286(-)
MASHALLMSPTFAIDACVDHRCCSSSIPTCSKTSTKCFTPCRGFSSFKRVAVWGHWRSLSSMGRCNVDSSNKTGSIGKCFASLGPNKEDSDEKPSEMGLSLFKLSGYKSEGQAVQQKGLVLYSTGKSSREGGSASMLSLQIMSKEQAMTLAVQAAQGTGWTTGSGLKGPSVEMAPFGIQDEDSQKEMAMPWPLLTRSPRRRMRVEFTCNKCGERTLRAINPDAYKTGTVFVQCGGCMVFHKLVDNLNLFHELQGPIFEGLDKPGFAEHHSYDILGLDDI